LLQSQIIQSGKTGDGFTPTDDYRLTPSNGIRMPFQLNQLTQFLPPEGIKITLVLFLGFLIGLEREERKANNLHYSFGGVRTFPLIALIGYSIALLSGPQLLPELLGFLVVGGFLMLSYWRKISMEQASDMPGVTSEISGLVTYLVGTLVYHNYFWIATTLTVASMLLLELKEVLEGLTRRIAPHEILTFTKFLLLTAVILPVLPNQAFGPFQINPFKTWLVVVAVSTVSYGSYLLLQVTKESGILLSAILGGIYSSTVTTVALAKRSSRESHPALFAGAILLASASMYLRLTILVGIFNWELMKRLAGPFLLLAAAAFIAGWFWSHRRNGSPGEIRRQFQHENPLELRAAFFFAAIFLAILIITRLALQRMGSSGAYVLGGILGFADVDPFIMSMTQASGISMQPNVVAGAIVLAAASNNFAKGIYAYFFGSSSAGRQSLMLLAALALVGLVPIIWL
jgi:uncharacterized membrane protein (DUF4010 family)